MKTRQRLESDVRREIERISTYDNTQAVPQPQPQVPTVSVGGTGKPVVFNLRFQEKTGGKAVDFVRTVIIPTGKLITSTNTAELLFDTLPNGTIHQTLRHTGVGNNTWEATSRMTTYPDSTLLFPAVPYTVGGVNIRGYTEDHPLLYIGGPTENSTSWGLQLNMPLGQGIQSSTSGQNYFETTSDSVPYSLKIGHLGTSTSAPVFEVRSNGDLAEGINVSTPHRGMAITIPETVTKTNGYGIKILYSPIFTNSLFTESPKGSAIDIETIGIAKRGINILVNSAGDPTNDEDTEGMRITVPKEVTALRIDDTSGDFRSLSRPLFQINGLNGYAFRVIGQSSFSGAIDFSILRNTGVQILTSRRTGWAAPTGTATRTTFNTATVTLAQLAERVKALIDDLTTHGLIGA